VEIQEDSTSWQKFAGSGIRAKWLDLSTQSGQADFAERPEQCCATEERERFQPIRRFFSADP
jgi:hypothetical protein